jgi:hypothetical protein
MRRCIITAVFAAVTLVGTTNPAVSFAPTTTAAPSGGSRHCPDSHVLVDSAPLVTEKGQRLGVAKLFAGQSTQSELPSPGFCFEVVVKDRYRKPFAPLRKKLAVSSPATNNPNVVGTTEPSARQFPLGTYASFFGPGCTARAKTVLRVGGKRATAVVRGAL